jgi:hypothetical protein
LCETGYWSKTVKRIVYRKLLGVDRSKVFYEKVAEFVRNTLGAEYSLSATKIFRR